MKVREGRRRGGSQEAWATPAGVLKGDKFGGRGARDNLENKRGERWLVMSRARVRG